MTLVVSKSLMNSLVCSASHSSESGPLRRVLYRSCGIIGGGAVDEFLAGVTPFVLCGKIGSEGEGLVSESFDLSNIAHVVRA